ncbi:MAG: hypothetical protein ACOCRK_07060, partial [bacterium]
TKTIDIYIIDQAGWYITKETIEFFGFCVDEDKYKNEFELYVETSDTILFIANNWLEENIKFENIGLYFTIDGDFKLNAIYELDTNINTFSGDEIPERFITYRKKQLDETMQEIIEKYFITGMDNNPLTNLDGYVSIWNNSYENKVMVFCHFCPDDKNYYYEIIPFQNKKDALSEIEELQKGFYSYTGQSKKELLKQIKSESGLCSFYHSLHQYQGVFNNLKTTNNIYELIEYITGEAIE